MVKRCEVIGKLEAGSWKDSRQISSKPEGFALEIALRGQFNSAQWQRPGQMRTTPPSALKGSLKSTTKN